ncbi:MAG: YfhO family protein [Bacteroidota bacterium]|nr:YfhO family protein [Bacteroidota bacterium]
MAAPKKEKSTKHANDTPLIPLEYQHFASVSVLFLSLIIFFSEIVFEGKVFVAADNIASKSFQTLVSDAEQQGIFPLWNPYIFCGMPGYASMTIHGDRYFDISAFFINRASKLFGFLLNSPDVSWVLFYYLLLGIGVYWFVFDKLKNKIGALVAALGVMHSSFIIILVIVGHMTKVPVIAFFPFIFLILERLREKFDLALSLMLIVLIHFMLLPGHIQMIFYCYFAFMLYYVFFFVHTLIKKEAWQGVVRSGLVLTAATGLAFAMTGDQYLSTLEYSKYSMRGADPIIPSAQAQTKGATSGGLDYDYATQWSFPPSEMLTFFIPSAYGFGVSVPYQGPETNNQVAKLPLYFGHQPWTDAPQYMGVVILILAGVGFWKYRKDPFVQYSGILVIVSLLISFGKEFSLLYDLMFNYFPMFNKFRIPSMMLILVQLIIPVIAGYGVAGLMEEREKKNSQGQKIFLYALAGIGVLLVLSIIAKDVLLFVYEIFVPNAQGLLAAKFGDNASIVYKIVTGMIANEIMVGLLLLLIALGGFYLYQIQKIKTLLLTAFIVVIVLADLWRVNSKPMDPQPHKDSQALFNTPDYVNFIKQDTTQYRTLEFGQGQPRIDNTLAYWRIQSAFGYQGAKMRQIQDMFDVAGLGNPMVWGLMNVKYILSDRPDSNQILQPIYSSNGKYVLYNRGELPRAFFVRRYEVAKGIDILNKIKDMSFDPRDVAFFIDEPNLSIDAPLDGVSAKYTHFGIQDIALNVTATGNNLLFLSESWYPEGWKAYINGNETPIHRINYMFRGVVVPKGQHSLTMKFVPNGFYLGKMLSLVINILALAGLGYFGFVWTKKKYL